METSRTITLFSESHDISQRPTSLVASILFHCLALGLLSFGVMYTPHLDTRAIANRYTVRSIEIETPEQQRQRAARKNIRYPSQPPNPTSAKTGGAGPTVQMPLLRQIAKAPKGPQTLIQPDLAAQLALTQEVPVPTMVIWSPKRTDVKTVIAPQPEKATAADVKPRPDPPNLELNLEDNSITAIPTAKPKLPTPTGTTSPIEIHAPARVQLAPSTVSQTTAPPTPAAIMSLSDLKMAEGKVVLPPVSESAAIDTSGALAPGAAPPPSAQGSGNQAGSSGPGNGSSTSALNAGPASPAPETEAVTPPSQGSNTGTVPSTPPPVTQITLPKDGQFGSVVVGQSLDSQYPELTSVWSGRLAYTVFLHVGLARSWILQYSLSRSNEAQTGGTIARLEAPWPYSIVRPNFPPGTADGNAIMVHGFVNPSGRFEDLSIIFPPQFQQSDFVLQSLQNWQFRPANQNHQPVRVEILLIIPGQM